MSTPPYYKKVLPSERTRKIWEIYGHSFPKFCRAGYDLTTLESVLLLPKREKVSGKLATRSPIEKEAEALFKRLCGLTEHELEIEHANFTKARKVETDSRHHLNRYEAQASKEVYEYHARAAYWTLDEGVALLLERDPRHFNFETIKRYAQKPESAENFLRFRELAQRAALVNYLARQNKPGFFLAWARRSELPCPDELVAAVEKFGGAITDWKSAYDRKESEAAELSQKVSALEARLTQTAKSPKEKSLSARERESLLKIILGMAMEQYLHDPYAKRTETAKRIESDIASIGLSLDQDTIREYLREARERFLPAKRGDCA